MSASACMIQAPFRTVLTRPSARRTPALRSVNRARVVQTQALFGKKGSGGKGAAKGQAYICKDCGYIEANFAAASAVDGYRCPVCRAPKRRFIPYQEPVSRNANSTATRKARKAELQSEAPGGGMNLAILIGAGAALLVALYVVLNATV